MKYVPDTNVLLDDPESIINYEVVISTIVLNELEKHKASDNPDLAYKARRAIRFLKENENKFEFDIKDYSNITLGDDFDPTYADNRILQCCLENGYGLITKDLSLRLKAKSLKIEVVDIEEYKNDDYTGYLEIDVNDERYAELYHDLNQNHFNLLVNQYLIVKDENEVVDIFKWTGEEHVHVKTKSFTTKQFGKFTPRDAYQRCALDSLKSNQMTMIKGKAGSGKSLIALNYAFKEIEKGKYTKLICFVNPTASRNSAKLGYYPGSRTEKLLDSSVGSMLASKLGDVMELERWIAGHEGGKQIVLLPFSDIRGFDSTGMNAIVYIIEAQNLDIELMKLAIQRVGEDSKLIIDGDYEAQVDHYSYEGANNGMRRLSQVFRGENFYGEIELPIIYRSKIARKADDM